ncbi:MAG: hypothetical protein QM784_31415 [Polyangiaceae bacterium]
MADFNGTAIRRASSPTSIQYRVTGSTGLTTIYVNTLAEGTNWGEYAPNTARLWVTPADSRHDVRLGYLFPDEPHL